MVCVASKGVGKLLRTLQQGIAPIASGIKGLAGTLRGQHVQATKGESHVGGQHVLAAQHHGIVNATGGDVSDGVMQGVRS